MQENKSGCFFSEHSVSIALLLRNVLRRSLQNIIRVKMSLCKFT